MAKKIKIGNTYFYEENPSCRENTTSAVCVFEVIYNNGNSVKLIRDLYQSMPTWRFDTSNGDTISRLNLLDIATFITAFEQHELTKKFDID